jgi:hypothetical protein
VDVFVSDAALAPAHRRLLRQHGIELHLTA